jgi:hypothetical protein
MKLNNTDGVGVDAVQTFSSQPPMDESKTK